jgi:hypothetical protein
MIVKKHIFFDTLLKLNSFRTFCDFDFLTKILIYGRQDLGVIIGNFKKIYVNIVYGINFSTALKQYDILDLF